jgi:ATP-dependent RNA helicase DeaD
MPSRPTDSETPAPGGFSTLGLDPRVVAALTTLGYEEPTPIQLAAIPVLMQGRDMLAMAATGTGKTAAFALPLLHRLTPDAPPRERTAALVLVPTRELAMQVAEAIHRYGKALGAVAMPVYGGTPMDVQIRALKRGTDVVVATPGRALDHIRRKTLHLSHVKTVVLDEADEMLDMGFAEDLEAILAELPSDRQTCLFSATLPPRIDKIAKSHLKDPMLIRIDREAVQAGASAKVRQVAYIVPRAHKMTALARVLDVEHPEAAIVFCRTRTEVDELTGTLIARGLRAEALHGGLNQDQRDRVMKKFRGGKCDLLIATDVAARGLDVQHVTHVVNYDVPSASEAYVHRIGRTGRAGRTGVAITFAEPREHRMLRNIEAATKQKIEVKPVPSVADLRAKRLEHTREVLRETIMAGELDMYRTVVQSLSDEFDIMDVAAAAVKRAAPLDNGGEEQEIPAVEMRPSRGAPPQFAKGVARYSPSKPRPSSSRTAPAARATPVAKFGTADATASAEDLAPRAGKGAFSRGGGSKAKIWVGAGRKAKVRPGDVVGAIVNEAGVAATALGAITTSDRFTLVEVPEAMADQIVNAMSKATIKGKKVLVRRDRA